LATPDRRPFTVHSVRFFPDWSLSVTDIYLDPARKHDAVLLFDVTDGNPNGDPDNSGAPRTDLETGHGIVTDVALKRKIRDVIPLIAPGRKGYDIYVEAGVALEERYLRAYAGLGADPKAKTQPVAQARDWMIEHFFDVRMFGAVMASKIAPAGKTRGPVQLTFARSVDPVLVVENGITRVTQTRQTDIDDGQTTEMGTKWTIPYALYRGVIHFSASLAAKAKVTHDDLDVFWRAVTLMFEHDRAATRGEMALRGLYVFTHDDALGRAPAHQLSDLVTVGRSAAEPHAAAPPRHFSDYRVGIDEQKIPVGVTLTSLVSS
jgi:CRISPR-associated protein Csd2